MKKKRDEPPCWQRGSDPDELETVTGLWPVISIVITVIITLLIHLLSR